MQRVADNWVKRDDLFTCNGLRGGKARTCYVLVARADRGLTTASARVSPQSKIVAALAETYGLPCRIHTAWGELTEELLAAEQCGAEIIMHRPGYNSVIRRRARDDADARGWSEIPFGMESEVSIQTTSQQVRNLPKSASRLVIPVGSGMTLAGIAHGLNAVKSSLPVLGVVVGANPTKRLETWAPDNWRERVTLVQAAEPYNKKLLDTKLGEIELDPVYEAKCLRFLEAGDCLWIVGFR